ncbi:type II secretion system pilot lipoprotein GspS-beta [Salinivibrio sp. ES.052]|uniref:type II secretion system pilot lipoprotein GspS-beta n=1 Tax=Salinivibrio sp. ES.052 TaxID=1882823 RepID=UPI000925A0D2|nr:type II secretion system pilot lipoprotein GspS-beta [Salinivibrio sp. ES.052]SIN80248.1 Type II secretion system (T2SS) pilotin, S protein [Salinivibrio sp. ES.052]
MRLVKVLMMTGLGLILSACSSTQHDQAAEAAIQRADMIAQLLPMDIEGYSLVRARAQDAIIELTLLEKNAKKAPGQLFSGLKRRYCEDNDIRSMLNSGISYTILVRDTRGRQVLNNAITAPSCAS